MNPPDYHEAPGKSGQVFHFKISANRQMLVMRYGQPEDIAESRAETFPLGLYRAEEDARMPLYLWLNSYPTMTAKGRKVAERLVAEHFAPVVHTIIVDGLEATAKVPAWIVEATRTRKQTARRLARAQPDIDRRNSEEEADHSEHLAELRRMERLSAGCRVRYR